MEDHNIKLMKKLFTTAFFVAINERSYRGLVKLTERQAVNYGDEIITKLKDIMNTQDEFSQYLDNFSSLRHRIRKGNFNFSIGTDVSVAGVEMFQTVFLYLVRGRILFFSAVSTSIQIEQHSLKLICFNFFNFM